MKFPNPLVRMPRWCHPRGNGWLARLDRWRWERGILTGRWNQAEIDDQILRAQERRAAYFAEHGIPWERTCTRHGEWWCPDCGEWINHGDTKAVGDFTVHQWCS